MCDIRIQQEKEMYKASPLKFCCHVGYETLLVFRASWISHLWIKESEPLLILWYYHFHLGL